MREGAAHLLPQWSASARALHDFHSVADRVSSPAFSAGTNEPRIFVAQADSTRTRRGQAAEKLGDRKGRRWRADVGKQVFAVISPNATETAMAGKASGCAPPVRAAFHLCPLMRIREAFRYFWPA
jgi:hypothetical protein